MSSQKADSAIALGLGNHGVVIVSDTTATTGPFVAVQCVTDSVFSAFSAGDSTGTFTGITFPAHFIIRAPIASFTMTSGTVLATKGNVNA